MSVGARLAQARESLGITLEELSARTRIRVTVLSQIEADNFQGIDAEVYIRAHLRSIAAALHLDPVEIANEYSAQTGSAAIDRGSVPASLDGELNIFEAHQREALPKRRTAKPVAILGVALLAVGAIATQLFLRGNDEAKPIITLSAKPTSTNSHAPSPTNSQGVDPSIVTVVLKINQRSWISVTASNGEKLLAANVNAGETRAFTDSSSLVVTIGNAPGVEVSVNGFTVGQVGQGQSVVTRTFGLGSPAPESTASPSA